MSFYKKLSKVYDGLFPLRKHTLLFVSSLLEGEDKAVLDIGCATGELALSLAGQSHHVTGIDLDSRMIGIASDKAKQRGISCTFLVRDMLELGKTGQAGSFDLITCLGNTLVHLDSRQEIGDFFQQSYELLKKNGQLAFQVVNYDRVLHDNVSSLPPLTFRDATFGRDYRFDHSSGKIIFSTSLTIGEGETLFDETPLFPLLRAQAEEALRIAGFEDVRIYGTFKKESWNPGSPATIAVARK